MKDDTVYLKHILECIGDVDRYTQSNKGVFIKDDIIYNACLRQLQIMAESTTRLSGKFKENIVEIPWNDIAGFRNSLGSNRKPPARIKKFN